MDKKEVLTKLNEYKRLLSQHMTFDALILFGSHAKGTAGKDSDIDVAIVVEELNGDYFSTRPLIWRLRREIDDRIEPIIVERKYDKSGFLDEITRHGILIQ